MKKETKIKFISGALVVMLANGIAFATPVNASAEIYKQGTFIEESIDNEESQYLRYVADKKDNLSRISRKICKYYGVEVTTKYWPVIAYLNGIKKALVHPGDIIIFPSEFDDLEKLYNNLKESGWISLYIKNNNVYKKKDKRITVGELLSQIYGDKACVDPDFAQVYLKMQGLEGVYDIDSVITDNNMLFFLTEWIPSLEDINEFWKNNPPKIKKQK